MDDWEKRIGLADMHGTVVRVYYTPSDEDGPGLVQTVVTSGGADIRANPTPEALRQWAAALLDGADALENE